MTADEIRARLRAGALTPNQALREVDAALPQTPSMALWMLRGVLIQVAEAHQYELEDAAESYRRAIQCAPDNPEPYEELGHFYDAVMGDLPSAEKYFREALSRGADPACAQALEDVLRQRRHAECAPEE